MGAARQHCANNTVCTGYLTVDSAISQLVLGYVLRPFAVHPGAENPDEHLPFCFTCTKRMNNPAPPRLPLHPHSQPLASPQPPKVLILTNKDPVELTPQLDAQLKAIQASDASVAEKVCPLPVLQLLPQPGGSLQIFDSPPEPLPCHRVSLTLFTDSPASPPTPGTSSGFPTPSQQCTCICCEVSHPKPLVSPSVPSYQKTPGTATQKGFWIIMRSHLYLAPKECNRLPKTFHVGEKMSVASQETHQHKDPPGGQ